MSKQKDAPSSVLTSSGRKILTGIQASTNPLNTRKSPRFQKQMGPAPSIVKKKLEKRKKQMGSTPLRRSERVKNPVDVPVSNITSTEKSADITEDGSRDSNGGNKKWKRYHAVEFKAACKPQQVRVETEGSEVVTHIDSPLSSGDQFWSDETPDSNANSLYQHLKPTVSELCNILKFSEGAKIIVERFLKFIVGNFNVSKETNILQALMISVCWICSSLLKHTFDREESLNLARKRLDFSCKEEEANQVYEKLKKPKEMFLQSPENLKVLDAFKDRAARPEEPRMSPAVPLSPEEHKRENHGSTNEEALQSSGQILEEDTARKERNEIFKFNSEWDKKTLTIVNDFIVEKSLISYLHGSNSSLRSEKLNLAEKEYADKLNEHERLRQVCFNDLKAMLKVADKFNDFRLEKTLLGNPIEAESHDKPMHDTCPVVVLDEVVNLSDASNDMMSGSHTSEKHMANAMVSSKPIGEASAMPDANMVNDVAGADTSVISESIGDIPAKSDAEATVLSELIGDIPAIEETSSEHQDEVENVVSGDDAMVSSEPIQDISGRQDADIGMAPNDSSADVSHAVEDPHKNGSKDISLEDVDDSHAVEDPNGTGPNHVAPTVESVELGIPAGNCNQEKEQDTSPSVQQVASPFFDHSMPAIPELHNDSHLLQQPSEDMIQDQEWQVDPTPMVEIEGDNMQTVEAIQVDQIIPEESSLNPHNEPFSVMSDNPTITENQAAMLPTSEVLAQPTAAQTQIQRNANFNQVGSNMPRRVDPLHIQLEQLSLVKETMTKSYHDYIQKINIDCKNEIAEAIAEIRLKYRNKRQEADATFNSQKKEVESNMNTVVINKVLAATFRQKCQDVSRGQQQACQGESMQQLHRFRGPSTCLPGQVSGTQQPPSIPATAVARRRQQVRQPSDLFLTRLTRHPRTTSLRSANTAPNQIDHDLTQKPVVNHLKAV